MRDLGFLLWRGDWLQRNREEALGWFYEAAVRNDAPSMYMLGQAFERGEGVAADPKLAAFWLGRATERGYRGGAHR